MDDTRLESFPFDSKRAGYDDYGYPVYDRAVGATMLRKTFARFFSNGVFGTPGTALELSKGSGLKINIAEGIAIINGAMSYVPEGGISVALTDESTTSGTYAYGIFLRYDDNSDKRSCFISVRKGNAGPQPTPPEPERSQPGVWELRLGYVIVPTGSSDLSDAIITNEKGLANCPFTTPLFEVDTSTWVNAIKSEYDEFSRYVDEYIDLLMSALDGTTAGELQNRMTAVEKIANEVKITIDETNATIENVNNTLNGFADVLENATGVR